ncbi:MAG TPA: hypothetical protein VJA21_33695 [Verrucomicrobiae bacterium]
MNRREFIRSGASRAGLVALGATLAGNGLVSGAEKKKEGNPFAYDVERLGKVDPKLIAYEQAAKFAAGTREPRRIAAGGDGRLYIAGKSGVTILGPEGGVISTIALAEPARCVALAADGSVHIGVRDHLEVFDREGQRLKVWESPGKKTWFTGLAVGESDVFAADSGNRVILRYDRSGKVAGRIGEKNKDHNVPGLIAPSPYIDVALGKDGLLRVNNPGRHCVETYTVGGDLELSWGKPSAAIDGFCGCCNPVALALLPDGSCVTCEKGLPRVKVYAADGTFQSVVAGPDSFPENAKAGSIHDLSDGTIGGLDAAVDTQGRVYVLDLVAGDVKVLRKKA